MVRSKTLLPGTERFGLKFGDVIAVLLTSFLMLWKAGCLIQRLGRTRLSVYGKRSATLRQPVWHFYILYFILLFEKSNESSIKRKKHLQKTCSFCYLGYCYLGPLVDKLHNIIHLAFVCSYKQAFWQCTDHILLAHELKKGSPQEEFRIKVCSFKGNLLWAVWLLHAWEKNT